MMLDRLYCFMRQYRFEICKVNATDPEGQIFWVVPTDDDASLVVGDPRGIPCTMISSSPYNNRYSGVFENIEHGTVVMCMFEIDGGIITASYILGYTPLRTTSGAYGQTTQPLELGPGERREVGPTGMVFDRKRNGVFNWFYNQFCQFNINSLLQVVSGKLNGILFSMRTGKFLWNWLRSSDQTKFRMLVTRGYLAPQDFSASIDRPTGEDDTVDATEEYHDRFDLKMMDECADVDNVLELRTQQAENLTDRVGNYYTDLSVGKSGMVKSSILNKASGNKIDTQINGDDAVSLNVNEGKVVLTMTHEGNVTLKIDDDTMKILLGGSGGEQELLTKKYLD